MANLLSPSTYNKTLAQPQIVPSLQQPQQNAFANAAPGQKYAGRFAAAVGNTLTKNTSGFQPGQVGNFNAPGTFNFAAPPQQQPAAPAAIVKAPTRQPAPASAGASVSQAPTGDNALYQFPPVSSLNGLGGGGTTITLPNGQSAQIDKSGNIIGAPSKFAIDTNGPVSSSDLGTNTTSGDTRSLYAQYLQKLSQAYEMPPELQSALQQYNQAKIAQSAIQMDAMTNPLRPGDTEGFVQGTEGRQLALNQLQQQSAASNLDVQSRLYQSRIDASKALVSGAAPYNVGIGSTSVSPVTNQPVYQSQYLFKPSASQINSVAQQLLQSGAATTYDQAYNLAQEIVTNSAMGQTGVSADQQTEVTQSPVYQNATTLLGQGVPFDQVLSQIGRSTTAKAYAQQALNDFLGQNTNYNAAAAKAGYKFRQDAGSQTFIVNAKTAEDNIDKLVELSNKFPRSQYQVANMAQLGALAQTGNEDAVKLYTYATMLGDDLGKLLGSTGGSDYTTKLGQAMFNPNYSAKQLASVAQSVKGVIDDKVKFYNQAFTQGTTGSTAPASGGSVDINAYAW
jgi:hypothetical protein